MDGNQFQGALAKIFAQELSLGVCILDDQLRVCYWNPYLQLMTGIPQEEIVGKSILEKFPEIESRKKDRYLKICLQQRRTVILSPFFHEYLLPIRINKRGQKIFMHQKAILYPFDFDGEKRGVVLVIEDLSEQVIYEREINRLTRILNGLRNVNRAITTAKNEYDLLAKICKILVDEMGYLFAWVGYVQEKSIEIKPALWYGISDELAAQIKVTRDNSMYGRGVGGLAVKTGKIQSINSFLNKESLPWMTLAKITGSKAACAIPLKIEDKVVALLAVDSSESNVFHEEEINLLAEMGEDISFGIKALRDEQKRKEAEAKLIHSAKEWRETFDAINDGVVLLDTKQRIRRCNKSFASLVNLDYNEIIGQECHKIVHKLAKSVEGCPFARMVASGEPEDFEMQIDEKWYHVHVDPIFDESKKLTGAVHIIKDITQRKNDELKLKRTLEERGMLLQEIHHRVKNNLAVVVSLLSVQSRQIKDKEDAIEAFQESIARIRSMALVHEKLYHSHTLSEIEMKEFIPALVRSLYMAYNIMGERIKLKTDIDDVALGIERAVPAGLLLNELISNVFKHAFPDNRRGTLEVRLKKISDEECLLQVIDDGVGFPPDVELQDSPSLGLHLINLLADQIDGTAVLEREPKTCISVKFKLASE